MVEGSFILMHVSAGSADPLRSLFAKADEILLRIIRSSEGLIPLKNDGSILESIISNL